MSRSTYASRVRASLVGTVVLLLLTVAAPPPAYGAARWRDDFRWLNRNVWTASEAACTSPANVRVSRGLLRLRTTPGTGTGCAVVGARIDTYGKRTFRSGVFTARMRFDLGLGSWQTFWLTGAGGSPFPANGEVDIAEVLGRTPDQNHVRVHSAYLDGRTRADGRLERCTQQADPVVPGGLERWHVYSVRVSATKATFRVDGQEVASFVPDGVCTWPFGDAMRMILDVGSGPWGGPVDATQFPVTVLVDYVSWRP